MYNRIIQDNPCVFQHMHICVIVRYFIDTDYKLRLFTNPNARILQLTIIFHPAFVCVLCQAKHKYEHSNIHGVSLVCCSSGVKVKPRCGASKFFAGVFLKCIYMFVQEIMCVSLLCSEIIHISLSVGVRDYMYIPVCVRGYVFIYVCG